MPDEIPEWLSTMVEYEGCPLALRVRPKIDQPGNAERFPHLGIVSHKFAQVRPDGMPEPSYNATLGNLDADVHDVLEDCDGGLIMIVETFGGERNYYACVRDMDAHRNWLSELTRAHPEQELKGDFRSDGAPGFYRRYRSDFKW